MKEEGGGRVVDVRRGRAGLGGREKGCGGRDESGGSWAWGGGR